MGSRGRAGEDPSLHGHPGHPVPEETAEAKATHPAQMFTGKTFRTGKS